MGVVKDRGGGYHLREVGVNMGECLASKMKCMFSLGLIVKRRVG